MRYLPGELPLKYCLRWLVSLPCSVWEGVVPSRSDHREISKPELLISPPAPELSPSLIRATAQAHTLAGLVASLRLAPQKVNRR